MTRSFRKDIASLEPMFSFIDDFVQANKGDDTLRFALQFAVEELFTNLLKYDPESREDVTLELEQTPGRFVLSVVHAGTHSFHPGHAPDPDLHKPIEERKPGGLGLFLVRKYFDEIDYKYTGRTSTITLTKNLEK